MNEYRDDKLSDNHDNEGNNFNDNNKNNKKSTLIIIIVLFFFVFGAYLLYNKLSIGETPNQLENITTEKQNEDKGESEPKNNDSSVKVDDNRAGNDTAQKEETGLAPDFVVYDIDGKKVKLSDFIGKPTVVNFWASWCGPCKSEMSHFDEVYKEMGDDVNFVMVNMTDGNRETVSVASNYIKSQNYEFPVYYDTDLDAAIAYSVNSIPATYFIDSNGNPVARAAGAIDKDTLIQGIEMIK